MPKTTKIFIFWRSSSPLECDRVTYESSINFGNFPSEMFGQLLMNSSIVKSQFENETLNLSNLKKHVQSVSIYYDDIKYTFIDQSPSMTLLDVIASIGGTLGKTVRYDCGNIPQILVLNPNLSTKGLFIGVSFLSSIEFVEMLIEIICMTMDEKSRSIAKRRKKPKPDVFMTNQTEIKVVRS